MDDAKIVQLYFDRNEQAIPATADKYGNYCTSIAENILGNHEDAEECVNDTYFNAINEEYKSRLIFASYYDYILSYMNDLNKCGDRFNLEINAYNYVHFTYEVVVRMLWSDYCYQLEQMLFNK